MRARWGLGGAATLVACAAITGADDLTARPAPADADVPDARDATTVDAAEAASPEAAVRDDGNDATLGFCKGLPNPKPTLCADFEDGMLPVPWTTQLGGSGTATVVASPNRSAPNALELRVLGNGGRANVEAILPAGTTTEIVVGFSVHATIPIGLEYELAVIKLGGAGGNLYELQLEAYDNVLEFEEETPLTDGAVPQRDVPLGFSFPNGTWKRCQIRLTLSAGQSMVTFEVEGFAPVTHAVSAHLYPGPIEIDIGDNSTNAQASTVVYDDIVVNRK